MNTHWFKSLLIGPTELWLAQVVRRACLLFFALGMAAAASSSAQEILITNNSTWRWRPGTNEVSTPTSAWRTNGFNDATWLGGAAPFHFGTNASGGDDNVFSGTIISGMRYNYRGVFLRTKFVITNLSEVLSLSLTATHDDGFVAWVNGIEVARNRVNGEPTYATQATASIEPVTVATFTAPPPGSYLVAGTNTLTVQAFNNVLSGSDFRFDALLQITKGVADLVAPVVTNLSPASGSAISSLAAITVWFSEPVSGVAAADLIVNGIAAGGLVGGAGTNRYTFTFTQPLPGPVAVSWDGDQAITDLAGNAFAPTAGWGYTLTDNQPPQVTTTTPLAGAHISQLSQVEVTFNEAVQGLSAADLLVNGSPATSVTGSGAGPYLFQFPAPASGLVQFAWAAGHGISDFAALPNAFGGGTWAATLNPGLAGNDVIINEFLAGNSAGLLDEDGEPQDWIELYNRGTNAVNLLGWALTDDADFPDRWIFPSVILNPGQYLVVFASGKDRRAPVGANRYHTSFKLGVFGDYLALHNAESPRVAASAFAPKFPEQRNNYSYGQDLTNAWRYFSSPTPGAANGGSSIVGIPPEPHFSVERGFFDAPFNLLLTTTLPGATIRYTTDGREPTATTGTLYSSPVVISNTTIIRAAVFAAGYLPSRTRTHSYLYLDNVLSQPNDPPGFPPTWGSNNVNFPNGIIPADYEMDLDPLRVDPNNTESPLDPAKVQRYQQGLRELPVVSLSINPDDMFNASGMYHAPHVNNKSFPGKPCAVEMILPNGKTAFAVNGGLGIHGNASRDPHKNPKHGFKLSLKGEFGESSLKYPLFPDSPATEFDDLILRADFNSSWRHWSGYDRARGTRTRDAWIKETMRTMGQVAGYSRYFHLFINGLYWGTYDFSEQPVGAFARNYLGAAQEYDVYEQGIFRQGTTAAYTTMTAITDLSNNANFELMKQYLNVPAFIDYMLLHFFVGHEDWGLNKNWYAIRPRGTGPNGGFRYIPWDGENILRGDTVNRVSNSDVPSGLHTKLDDNAQYRMDFADSVQRHLVAPDGVLTPAANIGRWLKWLEVVDDAMMAEACRWGDYRRDVHPYDGGGPFPLYTREDHWIAESNRLVGTYFPARTTTVLNQLRAVGLYPNVAAPEFRQTTAAGPLLGSSVVPVGFSLALNHTNGSGTVYYTTNGLDPRVYYSGLVAAGAQVYSSPLTLNTSVMLKARVWSGGVWSALSEASFTVGELGLPLRIAEINFNPIGGDAYEFLEIQNIGAQPLDLGGFSFQGINFIFPVGTILQSRAVLVVVNNFNPTLFATRYPGVSVFGYFSGNLANGGERIALLDAAGKTVVAVHYDDEGGWPTSPDGGGYSLEIIDPRGDPNAPANWRASSAVNGTPGLPPVAPGLGSVVINEIAADNMGSVTNGGLFPDWIELHNSGGSATNITGWSLTDSSNARKFVFPSGTSIPAGGFLVVWCDTATTAPGLHTGFALGKKGETVSLFDANTNRQDAVTFGLQLTDKTVGRIGGDWQLTVPTPNAANTAAALASSTNLVINEWLANPAVDGQDWLELFNTASNAPVALRGLYLGTSNALFRYTALSFVPPRGHVQLFAEEWPGADQVEFKLPAAGGAIILSDPAAVELNRVTYAAQTEAVSQGRLPDGTANIVNFPGSASPGASNYVLAYTGTVLNEVLARNDRAALAPWGSYPDFVELINPGGLASVGGMAIGNSADFDKAWIIPSGVNIPAGGRLLVWCDGSRAKSTSVAGPHNTGFSLPGESGEVVLFNALGQPVDTLRYGLQVQDQSIGRISGVWRLLATPTAGGANSAAAALGDVMNLRFNEWMADPLAGDDWFELYNMDVSPVDLSGLYLSDNPAVTSVTNSPIAPLSFIGGKKWALFKADGNTQNGGDHANFSLASGGETLRLYDTNRTLLQVVDFALQATGASQGSLPDGTANIVYFVSTPSPGDANYLPVAGLVINEVLTHTDSPLEDAVEFFNPTATPVNIGGWYLSDSASDLKRYRIPDGTTVSANGFKVFYQYQFGPADGETDTPPLFTFNSAHGDAVYLSQADGGGNLTGYRLGQSFDAAANGVSFGRYTTSVGVDFVTMSARTFGVDNPATLAQFRTGAGAANAYPLVGPVVISEIMYHPPDLATNSPDDEEYIELFNISGAVVPLFDPAHPANVWRLANAVEFDFATNQTLAAGARLLVVGFNPTNTTLLNAFRARYGTNGTVVGPFSGKLDNAGETIELWRPDVPQAPPRPDAGFVPQLLVERVSYSDTTPWPTNADGGGASLQRLVESGYGNDPVNWKAGLPTVGQVNSVPAMGSVTLPGGGIVRLSFPVTAGYTYQVQYKNNLTDPTWLPLGAARLATGEILVVDDLVNQPQRFYRLVIVPGIGVSAGGGILRLSFPVAAGSRNQVQYKNNLTDPTWLPLGAASPATGKVFVVNDLLNQPQRFYRLVNVL